MLLHDITNILQRLELMANLLAKQDFKDFSKEEIESDVSVDLNKLKELFQKISNGQ